MAAPELPDVELVDQHGRTLRLMTDIVKGHVVAMDFVFTRCTTICSPMTAIFAKAQAAVRERGLSDVRFVSLSLDPLFDTPARLKEYADRFGVGESVTFLTGDPARIARVAKAMQAATAIKEEHAPVFLFGNEPAGRWSRTVGLAPPSEIVNTLVELASLGEGAPAAVAPFPAAAASSSYFPDVELIDQTGAPRRLYSGLMKNKLVVINFGFSKCKGACSPIMRNLATVQKALGSRMGKDVVFLTLSVDPTEDTPERLREFGARFGVGPGWYLLTGVPENVHAAPKKLGGETLNPDEHSTVVLIGDDRTGVWTKAAGFVSPDEIRHAIDHLNDRL